MFYQRLDEIHRVDRFSVGEEVSVAADFRLRFAELQSGFDVALHHVLDVDEIGDAPVLVSVVKEADQTRFDVADDSRDVAHFSGAEDPVQPQRHRLEIPFPAVGQHQLLRDGFRLGVVIRVAVEREVRQGFVSVQDRLTAEDDVVCAGVHQSAHLVTQAGVYDATGPVDVDIFHQIPVRFHLLPSGHSIRYYIKKEFVGGSIAFK